MVIKRVRLAEGLDTVVIKDLNKKLDVVRKEILAKLKKLIGKDTFDLSDNDIFISDTNAPDILTTINSKCAYTDEAEPVRLRDMSTDLLLLLLETISDNIAKLRP